MKVGLLSSGGSVTDTVVRNLQRAFFYTSLVLNSSVVFAMGGYSGGGGDYKEIGTDTAWYIGTKPIQYCIETSDKFGLTVPQVQKEFESAVATWRTYIMDRLSSSEFSREYRLNLNFKFSGSCRGTENLRLYLGVETPEVAKARLKYSKPFAFAHRESYDVNQGMGKGFIWFAPTGSVFPGAGDVGFPNWTKPFTLHGMMLHELGHVLGTGHIDGTIMREDMMAAMQFMDSNSDGSQSRGRALLTSIDDLKILKFDTRSRIVIEGKVSDYESNDAIENTFRTFVGRSPVGEVRARFRSEAGFELILMDEMGPTSFVVHSPEALKNSFVLSDRCFGIYHRYNDMDAATFFSIMGYSGVGTIQTKQGKTFYVQYSINGNNISGPVRITYIHEGNAKDLFVSKVNGRSESMK